MLVMMTTTMMRVLNSSQSHAIFYLTHISVYKHTDRMFEYIICTVYRQNSPGRLRRMFPTARCFQKITNVRHKVLQIILLIMVSSRMLFFAIFNTTKYLEYLSIMNQLNYMYTVYERNA
jgi:hypothetical protein